MIVDVSLKESSQKLRHTDIENTYQKESFYCLYDKKENIVYKYPIENIWRIEEEYTPDSPSRLSTDLMSQEKSETEISDIQDS